MQGTNQNATSAASNLARHQESRVNNPPVARARVDCRYIYNSILDFFVYVSCTLPGGSSRLSPVCMSTESSLPKGQSGFLYLMRHLQIAPPPVFAGPINSQFRYHGLQKQSFALCSFGTITRTYLDRYQQVCLSTHIPT